MTTRNEVRPRMVATYEDALAFDAEVMNRVQVLVATGRGREVTYDDYRAALRAISSLRCKAAMRRDTALADTLDALSEEIRIAVDEGYDGDEG